MILFQIALRQIYECCVTWVEEPQFCLVDKAVSCEYVVTRPDSTKPLQLWGTEENYFRTGVLLAHTWDEAKRKGVLISEEADVKPIHFHDEVTLNGLLSYKVEVDYDEGIGDHYATKVFTVLAYDDHQAESLVWDSYKPAISKVLAVRVMGEGKPLSPCILSIA
jgi:hypothetical protein